MIEIKQILGNKKAFIDLLLLADEQVSMIDKYLAPGEMFALYDAEKVRSICVVLRLSEDTVELKNIATAPDHWGKGYGSALIRHILAFYKGKAKEMLVGTGDTPKTLGFYAKSGFVPSHRVENFFTDNYDHPMIEDGVLLKDMVYLKRTL